MIHRRRPRGNAKADQARLIQLAVARLRAEADGRGEFAADIEACEHLSEFIKRSWHTIEPGTDYLHNWHIDAISEHLEAVTSGQITRLLINMPPRYMKSICVSIMWPVWEWTKRPETRFMFTTYSGELSKDHSNARRTIIGSPWFRDRFGHKFNVVKDDVLVYANDRRGVYEATSFTGTATGKGGNRLVVDDPHNPKQAESDVERTNTIRLFDTTFTNRLNDKKKDAIVGVMQRLHEEDVAARMIELGYVHLSLPAESEGRTVVVMPSGREIVREDGELLWPEREGPAEIASVKESMGEYAYASQYQQRPSPKGGGMFKDFEICHAAPEAGCSYVRYWDKAGTQGGGDYTAGVLMARSKEGAYYILDIIRGQWSAATREKIIRTTAATDGQKVHIWVEQEGGSGGLESAENTVKMLAGFAAFKERVTGANKEERARPMAAQAEVANVFLVKAPWNKAFIDECRMFPNGKHDDQVDAASGAFNKLALMARPPKAVARPHAEPPPIPKLSGEIPNLIPRGF